MFIAVESLCFFILFHRILQVSLPYLSSLITNLTLNRFEKFRDNPNFSSGKCVKVPFQASEHSSLSVKFSTKFVRCGLNKKHRNFEFAEEISSGSTQTTQDFFCSENFKPSFSSSSSISVQHLNFFYISNISSPYQLTLIQHFHCSVLNKQRSLHFFKGYLKKFLQQVAEN